jgi:tetratricopeptide (TPR) repeat protein
LGGHKKQSSRTSKPLSLLLVQNTPESSFIPALQCESTFFNSLGETSTAFECLLAAEELARSRFNESEDSLDMGSRLHPSFLVSLLYHLGRSAYTLGEFGLAYDYQCEALSQGWYLKHESRDDHEKQRFTITLATIWTAKAWCLLKQGLLSSSQDAFKEAKELYDQSQSHEIKNAFAKLTLPAASAA